MYEQISVDPFNHPTSRFTRHRWAARDMRHGAQGRRVRTDEEWGVGLGELVEVVVTQFVAEAHGDLQHNPHAGHLLLLPRQGERWRLRQARVLSSSDSPRSLHP